MAEISRGLLDTSVLIALCEHPQLADSLPNELVISAATLAELHYGVLVAKDEFTRQLRLRRLGDIEATVASLPIDAAVARSYASAAHAVKLAGRQPRGRVMDLLIAATAIATRLPLFTRNPADFAGVEQLVDLRIV